MKTISDVEAIELLTDCVEMYQNLEDFHVSAHQVLGTHPDSPLAKHIWEPFFAYADTLSRLLQDDTNFLRWYVEDNDCGAKDYPAKASKWKKGKPIKTIKDLWKLIKDSR